MLKSENRKLIENIGITGWEKLNEIPVLNSDFFKKLKIGPNHFIIITIIFTVKYATMLPLIYYYIYCYALHFFLKLQVA